MSDFTLNAGVESIISKNEYKIKLTHTEQGDLSRPPLYVPTIRKPSTQKTEGY